MYIRLQNAVEKVCNMHIEIEKIKKNIQILMDSKINALVSEI